MERRSCAEHGAYEADILLIGEREIGTPCPRCAEGLRAREQARLRQEHDQRSQKALKALLHAADIPARFQGRSFDNYRATTPPQVRALKTCRAYAEGFEDRLKHGGGLILAGKPGTGKTHLACAMALHIASTGRSVIFTTVMKAVRRVKETYSSHSKITEREVLALMLKPHLLILDEVGMQFGSDAERVILSEIINDRYAALRPTILLTNQTAQQLASYVGERAVSRMEEGGGVVLAFDWGSYRQQAIKDKALPWPEPAPVDHAALLRDWGQP